MAKDIEMEKQQINAFLGEGTYFKGVLTFDGTVRIDGKVEGDILTKDTLIVGEKGEINGNIKVGTIIINGRVFGNITATERVEIHSAGRVKGDIKTPVLVITEGVIFDGRCQMSDLDKEMERECEEEKEESLE